MIDLESRERMLIVAGLTVLDAAWAGPVLEPVQAWRPIVLGGIEPSGVVAVGGANYLDDVDEMWLRFAENSHIFDERGEFLISVAGSGASTLPWAKVRRSAGLRLRLAHALVMNPGEPEFLTMTLDGHLVCGVTTEEHDIWVVCANVAPQ